MLGRSCADTNSVHTPKPKPRATLLGMHGRLLTPKETSERLGLTLETLQIWRTAGSGPPWMKLGSHLVRYPETELEAWIGSNIQHTANREPNQLAGVTDRRRYK